MKLPIIRDSLSLVQVAIACSAVYLGGGVRWWALLVAGLLVAWAFVRPLPERRSHHDQRRWTLAILVALGLSLARTIVFGDVLEAGVDFLLLMIVQRFFNRQRSREHAQLLLLGGLLMTVGAVINTGLNYPVLLGAFLVIVVMGLIVNHLMAEGERLGPVTAFAIDREAAKSLPWLSRASLQVAAMAAAGGLLVFFVFPRFGAGVFLRGPAARQMQSGFSDEVQLGLFGRIKSDATVVMRIQAPPGFARPERVTWYLRGTSLDEYRDGRWRASKNARRLRLDPMGHYRVFSGEGHAGTRMSDGGLGRARIPQPAAIAGFSASTVQLHTSVILEDIGADVLFAASEPLAVALHPRGMLERSRLAVRAGPNLQLQVDKGPGPVQYEFISRIGTPTRAELSRVGDPTIGPDLVPYLQRSPGLSQAVSGLARELSRDAVDRLAKVEGVMKHLSTFRYTVDLEPPATGAARDPIESFLFDLREGHCEYFASAMAVLLREVGVPTRIVNGYYGAHWNDLGSFYAVRQADAHSWVEVHFGPLGWVTFDPTPASGRTAGDAAVSWPALRELLDAARNAYLQYVIDYDLDKQIALLQGLRAAQVRQISWHWPIYALTGLAAGFLVLRWRLPRRPRVRTETRLYVKVLATWARRGHVRRPHESAVRFARRMRDANIAEADDLAAFCRLYEQIRFGAVQSPERLDDLQRLARRLLDKI